MLLLALSGCSDGKNGKAGDGGVDFGPSPDGGGVDPACARASDEAKLQRLDLVFMLDRSGSMGDGVNGIAAQKWDPILSSLNAFFADGNSAGISASLQYFPYTNALDQCNSSAYYAPAVTMSALPNTTAFSSSLAATSPSGDTPTLPALTGALDFAKDLKKADAGLKAAVVLVTDGEPAGCSSSISNVSNVAGLAAKSVPTYVIGIGANIPGLDQIATAGGTAPATVVTVGDPATTAAQFKAALDGIRGLTVSCNFLVPAPPDGLVIDAGNVNVNYTPPGGAVTTLPYSSDCSKPNGWHYDDPNMPQIVELCPSQCAMVRQNTGRIDVVFGCATLGGIF